MARLDDLAGQSASADFVEAIPISYARQHSMVGLASDNGHLSLALASTANWQQVDVLSRYFDRPVKPVLASPEQITHLINVAYGQQTGQAEHAISELTPPEVGDLEQLTGEGEEDLLDVATRAPVIKLVNLLLFEAVKQVASDVHIQPYDDHLMVRMRIDGVLFDSYRLPKSYQEEVVSRIKVVGRMNIAEKRLAQDGRATVRLGDRIIDLRIASLPTSYGERIVIRLLDKSARLYTLGELGMEPDILAQFRELIHVEHGLMLVTGPTGSGKTTTLYAALQEIDHTQRNVLTLEDPIEYQLPGVSQTQVSNRKGMTFASGLRHVLRQDPDIIMVGEIRDHETAVMAIQSALTGHMVFSTLHTNDAASAITRLLDLGIEPYLVASSVVGVLAQRLVRCICPDCSQFSPPEVGELERLGMNAGEVNSQGLAVGSGCETCRKTGYKGRAGVFELLAVNDAIRGHIQRRDPASDIKTAAINTGMRTLLDTGIAKIINGTTTIEEVLRVTVRSTP